MTPFLHSPLSRRAAVLACVALVAACASRTSTPPVSSSMSADEYKRLVAQKIYDNSRSKVFAGQPQALLRAVIVLRFKIDADGRLVSSEIMRTNRDRETENTALNSLRAAAPFAAPSSNLLSGGRVELSETWVFNNDGRFQVHTLAEKQKGE